MTDPWQKRVELCGGRAVCYLGDCLEILPTLEAGSVDAVVTDPPYGIGIARSGTVGVECLAPLTDYGKQTWDDKPLSREALDRLRTGSPLTILFGANYYADRLPPSKCWIVWDKGIPKGYTKAQVELAWTNNTSYSRIYNVLWHGMIRDQHEKRYHPTQKPITLMVAVIRDFVILGGCVADPYMGSGTTGVAAIQTGRRFIGIEIDERYFDIACQRIAKTPVALTGDPAKDAGVKKARFF